MTVCLYSSFYDQGWP